MAESNRQTGGSAPNSAPPGGGRLAPLFLLNDEPIGSHTLNAFAKDSFARIVASAALGTTGPFTIGVYGGWGSGKTSALHAARTMIADDPTWRHVVTVDFNAWRFEREEHPIVPLVATIERAVAAKARALKRQDPEFAKWYQDAGTQCRAFLAGWQFKFKAEAGIPLLGKVGIESTWTAKDAIQRYAELQKELKGLNAEQWAALGASCLSLSAFDALDRFGESLGSAAGTKKDHWPLVVVFIDDLDRCQADKAFELLESVKLVLCQPHFVFVLALNHEVVDGYLTHRAEQIYGVERARLHRSYLEKIVQLPLTMPSRAEKFEDFARHLIEKRLSPAADAFDPLLRPGLKQLAKLLALCANRTPRSLVRRINTALIDIALRDPATLPGSLKLEEMPFLQFSGLCIVQRTLEAALGADMTRTLAEDNALCEVIAKDNIWGIGMALKAEHERQETPVPDRSGERAARARQGWNKVFDAIWSDPANKFLWCEDQNDRGEDIPRTSLFTTSEGQRWLTQHLERRAMMQLVVRQPEAEEQGAVGKGREKAGGRITLSDFASVRVFTAKERAVIEGAARKSLQLPPDAPLDPSAWGRVDVLDLTDLPISDDGADWLARHDSGLGSLTKLQLSRTGVGDSGVAALAAPSSGLKSLLSLYLIDTGVGDAGAKALAAQSSGLKALAAVYLSRTKIGNEGARAFASPDSGLRALTGLYLGGTHVGDDGVAALAAPNSGLRALTELRLWSTTVGDTGVAALAASDSGLKALSVLDLDNTQVGDEGAAALGSHQSGLQALTQLHLRATNVSAKAAEAIRKAHPSLTVFT